MKNSTKKHFITILKLLVPLGLLAFIFWEGRKFINDIDLSLLKKHINDMNIYQLLLILFVGLAGVFSMTFYDFVLNKRLDMKIPKFKLIKYSFISNTMANLFGFGGFAGAALRTYFYQRYKKDRVLVLKGIAENSVFYLTGLSVLCSIFLFGFFQSSILEEYSWLKFVIWGIALYLPIMVTILVWTKRIDLRKKEERTFTYSLIIISTVEWFFVFFTIYVISKVLGLPVTFAEILSIGVVGASAGVVSMIPGGLGSFDLILILGLTGLNVMEEQALLLLLLYRISYYFFPFIVGFVLLIRYGWKQLNEKWSGVPEILLEHISHLILTLLVFFSGVILLTSASLPAVIERLRFMHRIISMPLMNLSHLLSVAVGITLLGLARGIEYKVKRAYYLTFVMLIVGAIFTLSKGFDYEEAIFVLFVAWVLWLSRGRFYRLNFVHTWGRMSVDLIIILGVLSFYLVLGYANLPEAPFKIPAKFRDFIYTEPSDLWFSGIIGFLLANIILLLFFWIKGPLKWKKMLSNNHTSAILNHLDKYGGTVLSHLMFLHDKAVYWTSNSKVLFSYQTVADKLVVLGDPVGEKELIFKAIEELRDNTDRFGYTPIYYQVSQTMLPYLHENGYDFLKLGEEGYVNLEDFSLSGKKMKSLRASKNKFDKDGYRFEIIHPPFSQELFQELKKVSDHWLGGREEKGYSLGFFDREYLSLTPLAIVKNPEADIIAFASIMPVYDRHQTVSIDLMRFMPESPNGTMDYLFLNTMEWSKQEGYKRFNLGMAPLSNVGISKYSFLSEKIAAQIYNQGHVFYHFQGVKRFKEKYADYWEPKFLAYKKKTSLFFTMLQLTYLIGRKNTK
ncbi:bifunctional lysylphosphatidylglycerol flippase/synthetase MprF [Neobacillus sp. D3-1R]|uniref:bifunctional lysylphosphatidylglycerol flippase/synthetase MprF n=1 Tax=Neobacillus sp. D3-1R TaxID=3445778 RepID=UPI003FA168AD